MEDTMSFKSLIPLAFALSLASGTALADNTANAAPTNSTSIQNSMRGDRTDNLPDNGMISLTGTVERVINNDEFDLSYGGGVIRVDTNDAWPNLFKRDANTAARQLSVGDRVSVMGKIDNNFFTKREVDAYSLRHEQGGEIFNYEPKVKASR
jgi:uncharacterized protein YdeI (BOF family)